MKRKIHRYWKLRLLKSLMDHFQKWSGFLKGNPPNQTHSSLRSSETKGHNQENRGQWTQPRNPTIGYEFIPQCVDFRSVARIRFKLPFHATVQQQNWCSPQHMDYEYFICSVEHDPHMLRSATSSFVSRQTVWISNRCFPWLLPEWRRRLSIQMIICAKYIWVWHFEVV